MTSGPETGHAVIPALEQLDRRVRSAAPAPLLLTTAHLLGDATVLREEWRPDAGGLPCRGYADEVADEIREYCAARLRELTPGDPAPGRPGPAFAAAAAAWLDDLGGDDELEMIDDALVFDGEDPHVPNWTLDALADGRTLAVAVIGSGLSGLLAALRLKQAGIPFTVFEKDGGIGGTWFENDYPDCRTDVASHIYMYSFESYDWPAYFSRQATILDFLGSFARKHGLLEHVRLLTEVTSAAWDDERQTWSVRSRYGDEDRVEDYDVVISAVGQLNRPSIPDIPGAASFRGPRFHSAEWDYSVDLEGRQVAVLGTGASALQFAPAVARIAEHVTIVQRTPPWLIDTPELRRDIPDDERWLFAHLPTYRTWYRYAIFLPRVHGQLDAATVDLDYPPTESAVSAAGEKLRAALTSYLDEQIGESEELRDLVTPRYPPGAKRVIRDDGTWLATLKRPDVSVVSDGVSRIVPEGIVTESGKLVPCDVILYGTGFQASDFLMPMSIHGLNGDDLHERWGGDSAAYLGLAIPDFPNLFVLYGPNTGVVVHGNLVFFTEAQVNYVMDALAVLLQRDAASMTVRRELFDGYQGEVDEANALRAWGWSGVSSWYKNARGRSPIMWPFSTLDYWQRTRRVDAADYSWRARHPARSTRNESKGVGA